MATDRIISDIDRSILEILQNNARESQADIARAVGLAPSAVLERIRKLEARGVIRGYIADIDPRALDQGMLSFVAVRSEHGPDDDSVARALAACPAVLEVHHVAGEDCFLVKVRAADTEALGRLLRERLGKISTISSTRTTIVLESVKETIELPIVREQAEEEEAASA